MASKAGILDLQLFGADRTPVSHNPNAAAPGLQVKAAEIIYAGVMVAYDPATSAAQSADPAQPATARVIGFAPETVDNQLGLIGALKISPTAGLGRVKSDGNLTAAHLFKQVRVIDDHTVGVPALTGADRLAGILVSLDGDYAWVLISPETALRAPVTVTLTSTNGTMAAAADDAAVKVEGEKIGDDVRAVHAALVLLNLIAPAA